MYVNHPDEYNRFLGFNEQVRTPLINGVFYAEYSRRQFALDCDGFSAIHRDLRVAFRIVMESV